jgi:hypothetical protein
VYVAGSGHTGSTLVALLLDAHPRIVSVGEAAITPRIRSRGRAAHQPCSCGATLGTCTFWQRIFASVNAQGYDFGPNRWTNDYRIENALTHRLLTRDSAHRSVRLLQRWCGRYLPIHAGRMRRADAVNVAFIRAALDASASDVFCDTTKNVLRLSRLRDLPQLDVKVIRLVRDVRGYVASAKRRGQSVADAARTWRADQELISEAVRTLPDDRVFVLKYEELCTQTAAVLGRLYRFCEVDDMEPITSVDPVEHHVLGNGMRLRGRVEVRLNDTWRTTLSASEQREALGIGEVINRALGFEC